MGLFKRKEKVNLDDKFRTIYREINSINSEANNELDTTIKYSQLELVVTKYKELLELIDEGANFERDHFEKLLADALTKANEVKGLLDED